MTAAALCALAFTLGLVAGAHSLAAGVGAVLGVGYAYGILRANVPEPASHFIFDAAVLGLYLTQVLRPVKASDRSRMRTLTLWVGLLIGWPLLLLFVPVQHPLVQLVGFRGNVFLLPFLLLGARLSREDAYALALWMAWLNVGAFGFAAAEFFVGIERFFPRNEVTRLLYMSRDVAGYKAYRIPACFTSSAAYGGTLVATLPWLIGAWAQQGGGAWGGHRTPPSSRKRAWHGGLFVVAFAVTVLGVFMSASRLSTVMMGVLLLSLVFTRRLGAKVWLGLVVMLPLVGYLIATEQRLQRFTTLQDIDRVATRIEGSVNMSLLEAVVLHPLGNGLGGGGTSVPHFLRQYLTDVVVFENEYARLALELGLPGLLLWLGFIGWVLSRPRPRAGEPWAVGRRLLRLDLAMRFAVGCIGTGLLTAIPGTMIWCLAAGWTSVALADRGMQVADCRRGERRVLARV